MPIVEKNDVDITPLFAWSREFEVLIGDREPVKVYMRILGDADLGRARVSALRRSAELRRKLRDENSDERLAYIKDIEDLDVDALVAMIIVFSMKEISKTAESKLTIKTPKEPRSDAKTSAHEKYQAEVDSYPDRRREELRTLMGKEVDLWKDSLSQKPKEELYNRYLNSLIEEMCEMELMQAFKEWSAYLGSYKNPELTERLFSSFEEFNNLPPELKAEFIQEYGSMELYGDELKKLRRVTE